MAGYFGSAFCVAKIAEVDEFFCTFGVARHETGGVVDEGEGVSGSNDAKHELV